MTTDPHAQRRVSATIKFPESARYKSDNPWLVFEGAVSTVREQIIEAFGMTDAEELTLFDLVTNAQAQATAVGNAASGLGGKVLASGSSAWSEAKGGAAAPAAEAKPEKTRKDELLAEIPTFTDIEKLKRLWAENQSEFEDAELMAAWSAKGKALKEAAAA